MASDSGTPQTPGREGPLAGLSPSQRALLRIACWVAWSDGDVAPEERELLEKLVAATLPGDASLLDTADAVRLLVNEHLEQVDPAQLVAELEGPEARLQAVKLAVQMMGSSSLPGDGTAINPAEKLAYRRLLEALALPEAEVQEAEWAARQELEKPHNMLDLIVRALGGYGAWPSLQGSELQLGYWL